ncbi:MAG TPA: hypothetical protein VLR52_04455, partial [Bacteroidales bacterium]|nr:hypothetical protein [Bacteroidales bacterium]
MKKFTILLMMALCLSVSWTFAQSHDIQRGKMNPTRADFLNRSPEIPAYWTQDSTWYFRWETSTLSWTKYEREIHLLDGQGNHISSTYLDWNLTLSEWVPGTRYYYEYYNDNRTKKSYRQYWNRVGGFWVDLSHTFYDTEGKVTETQQQSYNYLTNEISAGTQTVYSYTPLTIEKLTRTLVVSTMNWINDSRVTENYDADKMTSQIRQTWNSV